jgi:hypothetical protein
VLAGGTERGGELDVILGQYGMTMADIEAWGGHHYRWSGRMEGPWVRQGLVDFLPFHPAVQAYYESKGYPIRAQSLH